MKKIVKQGMLSFRNGKGLSLEVGSDEVLNSLNVIVSNEMEKRGVNLHFERIKVKITIEALGEKERITT